MNNNLLTLLTQWNPNSCFFDTELMNEDLIMALDGCPFLIQPPPRTQESCLRQSFPDSIKFSLSHAWLSFIGTSGSCHGSPIWMSPSFCTVSCEANWNCTFFKTISSFLLYGQDRRSESSCSSVQFVISPPSPFYVILIPHELLFNSAFSSLCGNMTPDNKVATLRLTFPA